MKKNILSTTLAVGVLAIGLLARAQETPVDYSVEDVTYTYQCSGVEKKLIYVMNDEVKDGVHKAYVKYGEPRNFQHYDAILTSTQSPLFKVDSYELFESEVKVGELKVVSHIFIGRGGCGRAGCDGSISQVQAELKLGNNESTFDCL